MNKERAIDTVHRLRSDDEVRQIQARYMAEMKPLNDLMIRVLQSSVPTFTIATNGVFKEMRYGPKIQEQINKVEELMQAVADGYRAKYPELFPITIK